MKPREPRRKVLIRARMRVAESWGDAVILNISSRGLLVQSRMPPPRGSYIELRRGKHIIIARAVWADEDRFGLQTQDALPVDAVIHEPDRSAAPAPATLQDVPDRRSSDRQRKATQAHEDSRTLGRLMEFACILLFIVGGTSIAFVAVESALASPFSAVSAALD